MPYDSKKYVRGKEDFPTGPHLAIIEFSSIYIEGDARSKSCPGHGYPAHTENTINYMWYPIDKREEWIAEIYERMNPKFGSKKDNWYALENGVPVTITPSYQIGPA